jgi:hypothetical protein
VVLMVDQPQVQMRLSVEELEALDQVRTVLGERTYGIVPSRGELARVAVMAWVEDRQREFRAQQAGPRPAGDVQARRAIPDPKPQEQNPRRPLPGTAAVATAPPEAGLQASPVPEGMTQDAYVYTFVPTEAAVPEGLGRRAIRERSGLSQEQTDNALGKLRKHRQVRTITPGHYVRTAHS